MPLNSYSKHPPKTPSSSSLSTSQPSSKFAEDDSDQQPNITEDDSSKPSSLTSLPSATLPTLLFEQLAQAGLTDYQAGNYREAIAIFNQALHHNPKAAAIWAVRAECLAQVHHYEAALRSIHEAVRLEPDNSSFQRDRELLISLQGMYITKDAGSRGS